MELKPEKGKYDFLDYDNDKWTLRMVGGRAIINCMIREWESMKELYEGNYLTGKALEICKQKFGGKENGATSIENFKW